MKNKLYSIFSSAMITVWGAIVAMILALLLFVSRIADYKYKVSFGLGNILLTIIVILTVAAAVTLYLRKKEKLDGFFGSISKRSVIIFLLAFFALQTLIYYNIYFKTGWDVRQILEAAEGIAANVETTAQRWYFLRYPNNLLMTYIFSVIIKICNALGFSGEFQHIFAIILIQCVLSCIGGYLLFSSVRLVLGNPVIPFVSLAVYLMHVALNPNITIPYSDAMTLILPIAILRIYLSVENGRLLPLKWSAMTVLAYLGYKIKPQVIIILIALVIYEAVTFLFACNGFTRLCKSIGYCAGVAALALTVAVTSFALPKLPVRLDEEKAFGISHFLMMGFNEESGGSYSGTDVSFSGDLETAEERTRENLRVVKERVKRFGFLGLTKFMTKKCLTNYSDGTYAWGLEGGFYHTVPEEKNSTLSPFLRSIFYTNGSNYTLFKTFQQYLWILILIGNLGILFVIRDKKLRKDITVAVIALLGMFAFEMLFEARSRYLFNYAPVFIFTASIGMHAMLKRISAWVIKLWLCKKGNEV